jgi:hypothetical protein
MSKSIASRTIIRLAAMCLLALSGATVATAQPEQPLTTENSMKQKRLSALAVLLSLFFLSFVSDCRRSTKAQRARVCSARQIG